MNVRIEVTHGSVGLEETQRRIAAGMGISWESYAARCRSGVTVGSSCPPSGNWRFRISWFGVPKPETGDRALSALRVDRSQYPRIVFLDDEDRRIAPLAALPDGIRVEYGDPAHGTAAPQITTDIVRIVWRAWKWRGVLAVFGTFRAGASPRLGIDAVSQWDGGHWRQITARAGR